MKKLYKAALLAALGIGSVTAVQASTQDVLLGFNDAAGPGSANNDYVLDLGDFSLFTTTATLDLSISSGFSSDTFSTAFGGDGNYLNNVAVGATEANPYGSYQVLQTGQLKPGGPGSTLSGNQFAQALANNAAATPGEYASGVTDPLIAAWSAVVATDPNNTGTLGANSVAANSGNPLSYLQNGMVSETLYQATGVLSGRNYIPNSWTELGTLDIDVTTGSIIFTGVEAVPEPTACALAGAAGLLLLSFRRRVCRKNA